MRSSRIWLLASGLACLSLAPLSAVDAQAQTQDLIYWLTESEALTSELANKVIELRLHLSNSEQALTSLEQRYQALVQTLEQSGLAYQELAKQYKERGRVSMGMGLP
jgi:uncharacterized protein YggE